jgi:hypothetical protein
MYSTPIHAVPKPQSNNLRLVNDHSAGDFSLNSMIDRFDIAGARLDTLPNLFKGILRDQDVHGRRILYLFKSDVATAYRRLILHFLWQLKQIVTINGMKHVDRCTSFGGCRSSKLWMAFFGLILWICLFVKSLTDIFGYMDDTYR